MANGITTAFWSVTINNPDQRDMAIVERGYPDYCRKVVWTLEEGDEGTPHIQAFVKLQRQQRMSFLRKLFPGGHFKPLTSDQYILNTEKYVQKNDETTRSAHVQIYNDPIHTLESVCRRIGAKVVERQLDLRSKDNHTAWDVIKLEVERDMVVEDFRYAKVFVSSTYKQMWKQYGVEMCIHFEHTHTHTHSDREKSVAEGITDDGESTEGDDESGEEDETQSREEDGEDYTEGETSGDETDAESGDYGTGEETFGEED